MDKEKSSFEYTDVPEEFSEKNKKNFWSGVGLFVLSLALALVTVLVINV